MKHTKLFIIFLFGFFSSTIMLTEIKAQTFTGDLTLTTQAQIDAFNYTEVTGFLTIVESSSGNITNLNGLSELTSVGLFLSIHNNTTLANLDGLSNLTAVGSSVYINSNSALTDLNGLSGVTSVVQDFYITGNAALPNLNGLSNCTFVGGALVIEENAALTIINLSNLTAVSTFNIRDNALLTNFDLPLLSSIGSLSISYSSSITNLDGFPSLNLIGSNMNINHNDLLTSIDFPNLLSLQGDLNIYYNAILTNIDFYSITSVENLYIYQNAALTSFEFPNLTSVETGLSITNNATLSVINFPKLSFITGYVEIFGNTVLPNIDGFSNLTSVGTTFVIYENSALVNIDGLSSLTTIGSSLLIYDNPTLSGFCGLYTLLYEAGLGGSFIVSGNAVNPSAQDIINGGPCPPPTGTIIIKKETDPASSGINFNFELNSQFLTVNSPAGIAATYFAGFAVFGPPLDISGITGDLLLVDDGTGTTTDACETVNNDLTGKIAVIDRGSCSFTVKVLNAQNAGAIAVVMINNVAVGDPSGGLVNMAGTDPAITIPSIFISKEDGDLIKAQLTSPGVNVTMYGVLPPTLFALQDGQMQTFSDIPAGTYTVFESDPFFDGYSLTNITIVDPDNGSSTDVGTLSATIDLDPGETVECTFTDTFTDERCNLDPQTESKQINTQYTLTYTLENNGIPYPGYPVTFTVVSGPNTGETAIDVVTDVNGQATFSYIGDGGPGTDIIEANVYYDFFICTAEVTWEQQFPFMTIWSVNDDVDGKLQYYTLDMSSAFLNIEGDILGVIGPKDLEDLIIDSAPPANASSTPLDPLPPNGGTIYIVNNVGTSTIYKLDYSEFDDNPTTPVNATLVGSTGLPTNPNVYSPEEISSMLVYDGVLYGLGLGSKKLYTISTTDGSVTQVATLTFPGNGDFRSDGMTYRPQDQTVYLLKTNDSGGESEIWKFTTFPGGDISYVRQIETSGKVEALTAHPDGYLYASDQTELYKISVTDSYIGYLADYTVDIEGMDYFYEIEQTLPVVPTRQFIPIAPTPVELVSFTAEAKSGKVELNWETATEVNNYGFDILRQAQDDEWVTLGFVDGHGNSNSPKSYSFTDINPSGGSKFKYRLKQIDNDGTYEYSDIVEVEYVPTEFALYQNYPNPFNPATKIKYSLPQESNVTIKIFDILGNQVRTLVKSKQQAGTYEVEFEGTNLVSGIYIYKMQTESFNSTKKMLLMK
jgi:PA domain/Secretion system C-terminal sorting domain